MTCTGTDPHAASTKCSSSSRGMAGLWWRVCRLETNGHSFSTGDRSKECGDQGNIQTFFVSIISEKYRLLAVVHYSTEMWPLVEFE